MHTTDQHDLAYRNGQLETELRIVKEQLAQALNANQFLLTRLAHPPTGHAAEEQARLQKQYERAVRENVGLKAQLALASSITSQPCIGTRPIADCRKDSVVSISEPSLIDAEVATEDLLSFDEEDASAAGTTLRPPAAICEPPLEVAEQKRETLGIGIANSFSFTPTSTDTHGNPLDTDSPAAWPGHGFTITNPDGTTSFVPTRILAPESALFTSPPPNAPLDFLDREHNRMMGMACFLEDQSEAERAEAWCQHALRFGRHSAKQYSQYYEEHIRPAYLAKMRAREQEQKPAAVEKASSTPGEDEGKVGDSGEQSPLLQHPSEAEVEEKVEGEASPATPAGNEIGPSPAQAVADEDAAVSAPPHDGTSPPLIGSAEEDGAAVATPAASTGSAEEDGAVVATPAVPSQMMLSQHAADQSSHLQALSPIATPPAQPRTRHPEQRHCQAPHEVAGLFAVTDPEDPHAYRTVTISNVPRSTTVLDILSNIHASPICSATIHATAGFHTNPPMHTNTATIVFLSGRAAANFLHATATTHTTFTLASQPGVTFRAQAALVRTVTRPLAPWVIAQAAREQHQLSRVLFAHDPLGHHTLAEVVDALVRAGAKQPLQQRHDPQVAGLMLLEFASITDACAARRHAIRVNWPFFRHLPLGFFPDPCAAPRRPDAVSAAEREREDEARMLEG